MASRLLIVEDELATRRFVCDALEAYGHEVFEAGTLSGGMADMVTRKPQLVILDLGLPDGNGTEFIRQLRSQSRTPIIVLSARANDMDKVEALDLGADDYLIKPFSVFELMARVRAALRRVADVQTTAVGIVRFGDHEIDLEQHRVYKLGARLHLTHVEFNLAAALVRHEGKLVTHRQLLQMVWGSGMTDQVHYLRIYMRRLRRKLEANPSRPVHFLTEVGVGYRFVAGGAAL